MFALAPGTNEEVSVAYTVYDNDGNVVTNQVRPINEPQFSFQSALGIDQLQIATQLVGSRGQALSQAFSTRIATSAKAAIESLSTDAGNEESAADLAEEIAVVESKALLPRINAATIVNVRTGPGTDFDVLGQILPENSYQVVSREGDWWEIDIGGNESGWIIDEFVVQNDDTALAAAVIDEAVEVCYCIIRSCFSNRGSRCWCP